jgi:hypothetical protein
MESVALCERSVLLEVQVLFDLVSNLSATAGPEHAPQRLKPDGEMVRNQFDFRPARRRSFGPPVLAAPVCGTIRFLFHRN